MTLYPDAGYRLFNCGTNGLTDAKENYVLDASVEDKSETRFCRIISSEQVDGNAYDVAVLLNAARVDATLSGVMYNVMDEDNYDFVLFG